MSYLKVTVAGLLAAAIAPAALGQEFKKEQDCVVGAKVADRQNRVGTVTSVSHSMCQVAFEDGTKKSYIFWMLHKPGETTAPADKLVNGLYTCYSSSGGSLNYAFIDINIEGPDSYRDKKGAKGKYRLEEKTGKIVFESGSLAQANAKLLAGPKIGLNMNGGTFFNTTCGLKK